MHSGPVEDNFQNTLKESMSKEEFNSLDCDERFLSTIIMVWSVEHRIALAAAMAERWLPAYEAFSAREEWGGDD